MDTVGLADELARAARADFRLVLMVDHTATFRPENSARREPRVLTEEKKFNAILGSIAGGGGRGQSWLWCRELFRNGLHALARSSLGEHVKRNDAAARSS